MRRLVSGLAAVTAVAALTACGPASTPAAAPMASYLVFYAGGRQDDARAAVSRAGGDAVGGDARLGYLLAEGGGDAFVDALGDDPAVVGVSTDRAIGYASSTGASWRGFPSGRTAAAPPASAASVNGGSVNAASANGGSVNAATVNAGSVNAVSSSAGDSRGAFPDGPSIATGEASGEPLASRQWDMRMIGADKAHAKTNGSRKVLVGIIDTGVDGTHPDIAPNFDRALSRNFVTDRPKDGNGDTLDGPCEVSGCKDPVDRDDDGHGTHVASTIGSPINGIGIAGVAPGVRLVNIRAGQDSGYFFLKASLDALTYAGDIGVDVVNMSYYVDPWLFNCAHNKADSKKEQLEQRAIITGMQRALDYARKKGVTLVSALGNGATDLGRPKVDRDSPGYPRGDEKVRKIDNSCLNVPAESKGVISVSAVGPSGRKAIYSDYGTEQADLSAPGGDTLDGKGTSAVRGILAAAPESALRAAGKLDGSGKPKSAEIVRSCAKGACSYYQYLEGTSMAAPHATGVAALLVSRFGKPGKGGVGLDPATTERLLYRTARQKACPSPRAYVYKVYGETETQTCEGDAAKNGFYGHGIVDALKAATVEK
ncbi:S8 family serine peptidase [Nonomuraea sp. NPDC050383]|uniref:S8 family serine peptidase n=1 Tax=Nonomuraea sp. NPDC050383 TaxID=3364362 RepID=UPI0037B9F733